MASHGIKDRVAIVGMGCTPFREHWDKGVDDLSLEASNEAFAAAGITKDDVDAYWLGTAQSGMSGITLSRALQLHDKPVTRVENYCASGSEALRQACYAVASGAYDVAMAVGVEKVKDSGYQGLNAFPIPNDGTTRTLTAAGSFSMVAPAYAEKYGVPMEQLKRTLARIASKNHHNGARNPRAQFRREMSVEQICAMPNVAGDLSVFDCAGVADGSAAAIVVRAEDAHRYTDTPIYVKALSFIAGNGSGLVDPGYDYTWFPEIAACAKDAYAQAGVTDPAEAARILMSHGAGTVIVTRGAEGAVVLRGQTFTQIPAFIVEAIDSTGAGDAFNGALACGLAEGMLIEAAVEMAVAAGALATTGQGAQAAMPSRDRIDRLCRFGRRRDPPWLALPAE